MTHESQRQYSLSQQHDLQQLTHRGPRGTSCRFTTGQIDDWTHLLKRERWVRTMPESLLKLLSANSWRRSVATTVMPLMKLMKCGLDVSLKMMDLKIIPSQNPRKSVGCSPPHLVWPFGNAEHKSSITNTTCASVEHRTLLMPNIRQD